MRFNFSFILLISCLHYFSQSTVINVIENTLKIGGLREEVFYFGFAQGDQLIFNFSEIDNKELKEIEIIEYPSNSKFMDYKSRKIENKTINVLRTGVYVFRLSNGALLGRVCKIKIDRIPASDKTKTFNTSIKWIEKPDTTWNVYSKEVVVGHDTTYMHKTKKDLVKTELTEDMFMQKNQRVHSQTNSNGNRTSVFFTIPTCQSTDLIKKKVVSLIYWVGVGEEASRQWQQNTKVITSLAKSAATYFTSPLGAYAVGAIATLALPNIGEDVYYALVDEQNKNLFHAGSPCRIFDEGKGIAGYKKITNSALLRGTWYVVLSNDNYTLGINVDIKVAVMVQTDYYEEKQYIEKLVTDKFETRIFKEPMVKYGKLPVLMD